MSARRWSAVLLAAVAVPLLTAAPAAAATSHQGNGAGEAWYNAGDNDPASGPNSFILRDNGCDRFAAMVMWNWDGGTGGSEMNQCQPDKVFSIAPLGTTAHTLRWRICSVDLRDPFRPHCREYIEDVVLTN